MRLTLPMLNILSILLLVAGCVAPAKKKDDATANVAKMKLASHAQSLKTFAEEQKGNMKYGILIDMSIPSWKKRFFVVDLETDSVLVAGMCTHGQGDDYQREEVVFSNVPNSLCTSEGRYKVGVSYNGKFGLAYKLHGLDKTNDKAYERAVVLHAHSCVSNIEGDPVCRSWGCPTVSPEVLKATAKLLDGSKQPVLMWIYK